MKAVVYNREIINIGEWVSLTDNDGNAINPMPDGAETGDFDVVQNADGKYVLASDYAQLRKAEYPSIGDQLDALFHAGLFPTEMANKLAQIKAKYPKP
jgi:hypothetical protein